MNTNASQKLLANQLKDLFKNPVVGFSVEADEKDIYVWYVYIGFFYFNVSKKVLLILHTKVVFSKQL
jgi:hypothetical protein